MAELKTMIFAVLIFITIVTGFVSISLSWFTRAGSTATLNTSSFNFDKVNSTLATFSNQTASNLAQAQTGTNIVGQTFVVLTGVYQTMVLAVTLPTQLLLPVVNSITSALGLPDWAVGFLGIAITIWALLGILNIIKGGSV